MDKMKVCTTTPVLKKAWQMLKELGLENLLTMTGKSILTINYGGLIDKLINENKLDEFCAIITKKESKDFTEIEFPEKKEILSDFFSVFGDPFKPLIRSLKSYLDPILEMVIKMSLGNPKPPKLKTNPTKK